MKKPRKNLGQCSPHSKNLGLNSKAYWSNWNAIPAAFAEKLPESAESEHEIARESNVSY
jgi:hypothetical protein